MAVSMEMIRELKAKTGAGVVDCKKTLTETNGNMEEAVDILRKKGLGKAAKKSGRAAKEGLIVSKVEGNKGLLVKVNCETDFVAKTADFKAFAEEVVNTVLEKGYAYSAELPEDLESLRKGIIAKLGENILISEWAFLENATVPYSYIHMGKVGVLVDFDFGGASTDDEDAQTFMKNVAMQITAMPAVSLTIEDVPADILTREKDIYAEEAKNSGKPEKIIDKIVEGKLRKFYSENVIMEQEFILDEDKSIKDLFAEISKAKGATVTAKSFIRIVL